MRPTISYRNRHLRCHSTDMDGIQDSLSEQKHRIKRISEGKERKPDETRAGGGGEGSDSPGSLARPESQVVTDNSCKQEGNETNMATASVGPTVAPDENTSAAAELLRGVRDSADTFGPLNSIAGCLCSILENFEVSLPSPYNVHNSHSPIVYEGK